MMKSAPSSLKRLAHQVQLVMTLLTLIMTLSLTCRQQVFAAGTLDTAFGIGGKALAPLGDGVSQATVRALLVQPDGKIVVLGAAKSFSFDFVLVRFHADGRLDTAFGKNGVTKTSITPHDDVPTAIALQADGKLVVVGEAPLPNPWERELLIARYNAGGNLDPSFGDGGIVRMLQESRAQLRAVAIQPDGKILVAGRTFEIPGGPSPFVMRYTTEGVPDMGFGINGVSTVFFPGPQTAGMFSAMRLLPNGDILLGGGARVLSSSAWNHALALVDSTGKLVPSFGDAGVTISSRREFIQDLALLPDGRILAGGQQLARYFPDGSLDESFAAEAYTSSCAVCGDSTSFLPNGRIVSGRLEAASSQNKVKLYNNDGRMIGKATPDIPSSTGYPSFQATEIAAQPDNKFIVAGVNAGAFALLRYLTITSLAARQTDFDGDDKTDLAVFRPSNNTAYAWKSDHSGGSEIFRLDHPWQRSFRKIIWARTSSASLWLGRPPRQ